MDQLHRSATMKIHIRRDRRVDSILDDDSRFGTLLRRTELPDLVAIYSNRREGKERNVVERTKRCAKINRGDLSPGRQDILDFNYLMRDWCSRLCMKERSE